MVTIFIISIIGAWIGIHNTYIEDYDDWSDFVFSGFIGGLFGFIVGWLVAIALPAETYIRHSSQKLASIRDNNSVNGSFYLGSGQIEGRMKFVFYYEIDGEFRMKQLDYMDVSIRYSDTQPQVIKSEFCPTKAWINYFAIDMDDDTYTIEIPKGSIRNNYDLDAQ